MQRSLGNHQRPVRAPRVIFDDIDSRDRRYDPALAYAQSKTANELFAVAAARHWGGDGIEINALHSAAIADSNLLPLLHPGGTRGAPLVRAVHLQDARPGRGHQRLRGNLVPPQRRGRPILRELPEDTPDDPAAAGTDAAGVAAYALDPEAAERLWAVSEQMNQ